VPSKEEATWVWAVISFVRCVFVFNLIEIVLAGVTEIIGSFFLVLTNLEAFIVLYLSRGDATLLRLGVIVVLTTLAGFTEKRLTSFFFVGVIDFACFFGTNEALIDASLIISLITIFSMNCEISSLSSVIILDCCLCQTSTA
jgi:hypothetical protein